MKENDIRCIDCDRKIPMREVYSWIEPREIILGQTYKVIIVYQCPKCKRIDIIEG